MWPQHLDEAADALATVAGPGVARGFEPCIEAADVVPIGDRDHIRKTRLIDIVGAVPMRRTGGPCKARGDLRERLHCDGRWIAAILHPKISHNNTIGRGLMARDERRIRRMIIVGYTPVASARGLQVLRNCRFHIPPPS